MAPLSIDNTFRHLRCPLCEGASLSLVGEVPLPTVIPFSTHDITLARPPELWRCDGCGSAFIQHAVGPDEARSLYASGDSGSRWAQRRGFSRTKTRDVKAALAPLVRGRSVLDVGCNTGELLDWARSLGARTTGVEYADSARATAASRGHTLFASLDEARGRWEVITAFDVVEHLHDVRAFLASCRERLAPGGRLVVVTGNPSCALAQEQGARWKYVHPPEHLVFPSPAWWGRAPGFALESLGETWVDRGRAPSAPRRALSALGGVLGRALERGAPFSASLVDLRRAWQCQGPDHVIVTLARVES